MRVLLIDPPGWQKHSINLGLSYLSGTLSLEDTEVKILDMNNNFYSQKALNDWINTFNPQVIGISVKTATANSSAKIINSLKESFPDILYVAGGPHITLCAEEFLKENRAFNFGILGEGEIAFTELTHSLKNHAVDFSKINGLSYCHNSSFIYNPIRINPEISRLAFPRFESIIDVDFVNFRYPLLTSRGCPYSCIFCCVGNISGKQWRARQPEQVIEELLLAKSKYQISSFEIMDDNFTFDVERAKKICRLLIKEKLRLDWWCHNGLRADKLDKELILLMKKAGCKSIAIGIESADEKVFNNIKKGESLKDIVRAVKMIQNAGLACVGYFIVGLPGDSIEGTKKTIKFQRRLRLSGYTYNIAVPYPGTRMLESLRSNGRLLLDIKETCHFGDNAKVPFETDELSKETLNLCYHLANCQGWRYGEKDLQKIRKIFKSRHQRDIERVVFIIGDGLEGVSRNLKIEYNEANIMEVKLDNGLGFFKDYCSINLNSSQSHFDSMFRLSENKKRISVNTLTRKLFLQDAAETKEEYIRGELLAEAKKWAKSEDNYYATHLRYFSPDKPSAKNGVIYKDGIALPFSHAPQWEKGACGKIESGIAFISLAAYNPSSVYTADYFSITADLSIRELAADTLWAQDTSNGSTPLLEKILLESDLLFVPESLSGFAYIFSLAKMNIVYSRKNNEKFALRYKMLDEFSAAHIYFASFKNQKIFKKTGIMINNFRHPLSLIEKVFTVIALWIQIIAIISFVSFKRAISKIITLSK